MGRSEGELYIEPTLAKREITKRTIDSPGKQDAHRMIALSNSELPAHSRL